MERYKKSWYDKRIKQNKMIKDHLITVIMKYKEVALKWSKEELYCLNYEDLFEIAVAAVNKKCSIVLGDGRDWSCGRDGKVSIARFHNHGTSYTAGVVGCKNKTHILALVYEGIQGKFYYFSFQFEWMNTQFHSMLKRVNQNDTPELVQIECGKITNVNHLKIW